MVTFYVCYVMSLFFPVAGPRYTCDQAHTAATAVWPAELTQRVLDLGDAWGAAFPSSHVAAAVVATLCALRYWRRLGLVLTPLCVGLIAAVVYGQFHYAVDALAGLIVAGAVLASLRWGGPPGQVTPRPPPPRLWGAGASPPQRDPAASPPAAPPPARPPPTPPGPPPGPTRAPPKASRPRPPAAAAAALAQNAAHVTWAGVIPSPRCRSRSSGRIERSSVRPSAGANSYIVLDPVHHCIEDHQYPEHGPFLHLVRNGREPAACDPWRVRIERHLFESHAVVHRQMDREEEHRHDRVQQQRERDDPQERHRLLQRGAPIVAAPVPQADVLQVVGRLDRVVHVHPDAEGVRERRLAAVQLHRLDPEGRGEDVGDDRHVRRAGERRGARRATRAPIRRRSRRRPAGGPRSRHRRRARGRVPGAGTADRASLPSSPPRTAPRTAR